MSAEENIVDASGQVRFHADCLGCGYDLYQQHIDGVCPECGHPIRESVVEGSWRGLPLTWLRTTPDAAMFFAMTPVLMFLFGAGLLMFALGLVVWLWSYPAERLRRARLRRAALRGGVLAVAGSGAWIALVVAGPAGGAAVVLAVVATTAWVVALWGLQETATAVCRRLEWPRLGVAARVLGLGAWAEGAVALWLALGASGRGEPLAALVVGGPAYLLGFGVFWFMLSCRLTQVSVEAGRRGGVRFE
ncbi:MAG: hypothetical protein AAF800_08815 [Planctomycetota bacterium]